MGPPELEMVVTLPAPLEVDNAPAHLVSYHSKT